ncbi:hypothetical protein [Lichenicoccus sp.]|uniref:hypothetical protein n=1 Tax=Lichenicoccus sp. TaxID=2781899 RepID=UPI003D11E8AA
MAGGFGRGRRSIRGGAFLLAPSLVMLLAAAADPGRAALVAELAAARGPSQAAQLEGELESLRQHAVQPTVRLLLRRAQRESSGGDHRDAVSDLGDALLLQPDSALLWRERAAVRAEAGDLDGAIGDLGGALARDPNDVLTWTALSQVEGARGSWKAALKAWSHVLTLDPMLPGGAAQGDRLRRHAFGQPA